MKKYLITALLFPLLIHAQYSIKGTFSPAENYEWLLLYKVLPEYSSYIDRASIDKTGNFEFVLDSTFTKGIYRVVYAVPQDEFNFDIIFNAKEDVSLTFNEETGIEYRESVENKLLTSYTNSMAMISQSIGNYFREQSQDSTALLSIFKTQRETQTEFENISENTIASYFIKANKPYIPDQYEDISTYISNLKAHYFDHVDFGSEVLQSSSFLIERVLNYVFGMAPESDVVEAYKSNVDDVVEKMKYATPFTQKMLLQIIWQQMAEASYENVANYISDTYLMKIAQTTNDEALVKELELFKKLSFGQMAPNFDIQIAKGGNLIDTSLYDLDSSECYVVVFWSSTCSHCLEELPKLRETIKETDSKQLQIIAIGLEDNETQWKNETINYPGFIHVLGLGKWDNEVGNAYNVKATPSYFVLDKNKKIISKPLDFEALRNVLCN